MRSRRKAALAVALALVAAPLAAAPAALAAPVDPNAGDGTWYVSSLGLDTVQATTTGAGVTVAVIDTGLNLLQPDFAGADVTAVPTLFCDVTVPGMSGTMGDADLGGALHGTGVALLVVGPGQQGAGGQPGIRGVAPGVALRAYKITAQQGASCSDRENQAQADAVDAAVADGARVITLAFGIGTDGTEAPAAVADHVGSAFYDAIVRAQQAGVVVITGAANDGGDVAGFPAGMNGTVTVEALTASGTVDQPQYTGPDLGVVAPGTDIRMLQEETFPEYWSTYGLTSGTSLAIPMVAGAVALSMSAWPEATSNQVLQALAATSRPLDGSPAGTRTANSGFGSIDLAALVATDPTGLPDTNPFVRADGLPSPAELEPVATAEPTTATTPAEPTAEESGEGTTAAPEPSETATAEPEDGGTNVPLLVGGIVVGVLLVGGGVVVAVRRSRAS